MKITREESSKQRRDLILYTAIDCFVRKGFHQTSIRDIAKQAEISLGNLYNYFDSKEALIAEIANVEAGELEKFEKLLRNLGDPPKIVEKFVKAYLVEAAQPVNTVLAIEITAEAMRNSDIAKRFNANRMIITKGLERVLSEGIKHGQFDSNLDKVELAEMIIDAIEGLSYRSILQGKKITRKSKAALLWNINKIILP